MVPALAILFIVVPFVELAVIIAVGKSIGVVPTLLALLFFSVFGAWLAKREGLAAWRRFQLAMAEGRVPTREAADGAMILLAGALLLTPGFLSDVLGILLLVPPTRALVRRWVPALARRRAFRRARITLVGRRGPHSWYSAGTRGSTDSGWPSATDSRSQSTTRVAWGSPELDEGRPEEQR